MLNFLKRLVFDEEGQGLVEYALIISLISIAVVTIMITLGSKIGSVFTSITNKLST